MVVDDLSFVEIFSYDIQHVFNNMLLRSVEKESIVLFDPRNIVEA